MHYDKTAGMQRTDAAPISDLMNLFSNVWIQQTYMPIFPACLSAANNNYSHFTASARQELSCAFSWVVPHPDPHARPIKWGRPLNTLR